MDFGFSGLVVEMITNEEQSRGKVGQMAGVLSTPCLWVRPVCFPLITWAFRTFRCFPLMVS